MTMTSTMKLEMKVSFFFFLSLEIDLFSYKNISWLWISLSLFFPLLLTFTPICIQSLSISPQRNRLLRGKDKTYKTKYKMMNQNLPHWIWTRQHKQKEKSAETDRRITGPMLHTLSSPIHYLTELQPHSKFDNKSTVQVMTVIYFNFLNWKYSQMNLLFQYFYLNCLCFASIHTFK